LQRGASDNSPSYHKSSGLGIFVRRDVTMAKDPAKRFAKVGGKPGR